FIGYEDGISIGSGKSFPVFAVNNFTGNLILTNSAISNIYVNLAGSTPANVLLLADEALAPQLVNGLLQPPVIANTNTNPSTQAAAVYSIWTSGSTHYAVPDKASPGTSRNTLIQNSLIQLASYKDPPIKDLPRANEDVRVMDVIVNGGVNSFDFKSVAPSVSPANHVSSAGHNAHSVLPATSSTPTRPWCKWISKNGTAAVYSATDLVANPRKSGPHGTQTPDAVDSCIGVR
ncbi:MAG: hypothetical protein M3O31_05755, partial [Acidobacteriota bacterium]|nr:hypothetical protein [Acidobacteriota bacterium]